MRTVCVPTGVLAAVVGCGVLWATGDGRRATGDGPAGGADPRPVPAGDAAAGRDVFRFETFGNEGFWTDAMRLPRV